MKAFTFPTCDVYSDGKHTVYRFGCLAIGMVGKKFAGVATLIHGSIYTPRPEPVRRV